eukprot:jgi/Botrbrau1/22927/Bobra.0030s0005.1
MTPHGLETTPTQEIYDIPCQANEVPLAVISCGALKARAVADVYTD